MAKNNRTEVVRVLREQMEAETDPQKKVEYAKQLAKLLPRPRQARRPRKNAVPASPSKISSRLAEPTGTALDQLSEGARITHQLVLLAEAKCKGRGGWSALTRAEKDAILEEVKATLSDGEREVLEAYAADESQAAERVEGLRPCEEIGCCNNNPFKGRCVGI